MVCDAVGGRKITGATVHLSHVLPAQAERRPAKRRWHVQPPLAPRKDFAPITGAHSHHQLRGGQLRWGGAPMGFCKTGGAVPGALRRSHASKPADSAPTPEGPDRRHRRQSAERTTSPTSTTPHARFWHVVPGPSDRRAPPPHRFRGPSEQGQEGVGCSKGCRNACGGRVFRARGKCFGGRARAAESIKFMQESTQTPPREVVQGPREVVQGPAEVVQGPAEVVQGALRKIDGVVVFA